MEACCCRSSDTAPSAATCTSHDSSDYRPQRWSCPDVWRQPLVPGNTLSSCAEQFLMLLDATAQARHSAFSTALSEDYIRLFVFGFLC